MHGFEKVQSQFLWLDSVNRRQVIAFNGIEPEHWQKDGTRRWRRLKRSFAGLSGPMRACPLYGQNWARFEIQVVIVPMQCRKQMHFVAWVKRGEAFSKQLEGHGLQKESHCLNMFNSSVNGAGGVSHLASPRINIYFMFYYFSVLLMRLN